MDSYCLYDSTRGSTENEEINWENWHNMPCVTGAAGSRLPLPLGYPLMEITPPQAAATPDPHPPSSNPGPALQPIPEEDEDEGQCKPAAPAVEADTKLDESAALSVGCALLMQLALEEGSPPRLYGSASTGMPWPNGSESC